jgi:hypothetical protein
MPAQLALHSDWHMQRYRRGNLRAFRSQKEGQEGCNSMGNDIFLFLQ